LRSTATLPEHTSKVLRAVDEVVDGRVVVVWDDRGESAAPIGALAMAAECVGAEDIISLVRKGAGSICLALTASKWNAVGLTPFERSKGSDERRPVMATIDARDVTAGGISAADQALTIHRAISTDSGPEDLVEPGHVRALPTEANGVVQTATHAEAAVDLARLGGRDPSAVLCWIQNEDGSSPDVATLFSYCERHELTCVPISALVRHRRRTESQVERVVATALPTRAGEFEAVGYRTLIDNQQHLAIVKGDVADSPDVPVHIHMRCMAGNVFHSTLCGCAAALDRAMETIESEGRGVVIYLTRDEVVHGGGSNEAPSHWRDLPDAWLVPQILRELGVTECRWLSGSGP
jgi:3,4-dihydroxy 2-butanone 4-phosphate synthase/GTP cyclohydrolase II